MTLDVFLSHFHHVRLAGERKWIARCPAHDDRSSDTLSLRVGSEGRRLIYCWAGCRTEDVLQAAGASWVDCFEDDHPPSRPGRPPTPEERVRLEQRLHRHERERRYGPWREYWALCDLIREERQLAATMRAWAHRLDPEDDRTWRLLEWAADLDRSAEVRDMDAEAILQERRHARP